MAVTQTIGELGLPPACIVELFADNGIPSCDRVSYNHIIADTFAHDSYPEAPIH